jgi:hypothetical protein
MAIPVGGALRVSDVCGIPFTPIPVETVAEGTRFIESIVAMVKLLEEYRSVMPQVIGVAGAAVLGLGLVRI